MIGKVRDGLGWLNTKVSKHDVLVALFGAILGGLPAALLTHKLQGPGSERTIQAAESKTRLSELEASNNDLRTRAEERQAEVLRVQGRNADLKKEIQVLEKTVEALAGTSGVDLAKRVGELSGQLQAAQQSARRWQAQLEEAGIEPWIPIQDSGDGR